MDGDGGRWRQDVEETTLDEAEKRLTGRAIVFSFLSLCLVLSTSCDFVIVSFLSPLFSYVLARLARRLRLRLRLGSFRLACLAHNSFFP